MTCDKLDLIKDLTCDKRINPFPYIEIPVILFHRCEFFCKITAFSVGCQCVIAETDTSEVLLNVAQIGGNVAQTVPQNEEHVAQIGGNVARTVPQNEEYVPQKGGNVPQNVPQNEERVPQNKSLDIKKEIVILINEDLRITREQIAEKLNISSKTVGRYLSKLGISWEGHPKTGHWKLP